MPLLRQVVNRIVYICKRTSDVVESVLDAERKSIRSERSLDWNFRDYPQLTWHLRDLFESYIDDLARTCLEKCIDELFCTQLLFWESAAKSYGKLTASWLNYFRKVKSELLGKMKAKSSSKQAMDALAFEIFDEQQVRITKNALLKCYDFFLVRVYE